MSRRAQQTRAGQIDQRAARMAPGGKLWSEARIEPFNPGMGDSGDVLQCESFSGIYMPHPTSVSTDQRGYVVPRAEGMPIVESDDDTEKLGGFLCDYGGTFSLGAPAKPWPDNWSYQLNATLPVNTWFGGELQLFGGGGGIFPDWRTMTYLRNSVHAKVTGLTGNDMFDIQFYGTWSTGGGVLNYFLQDLYYYDGDWHVSCEVVDGQPRLRDVVIPAFSGINPLDGASRMYQVEVYKHAIGGTLLITITNNEVYSQKTWEYSGPEVWPPEGVSADWDNQQAPGWVGEAMLLEVGARPRTGSVPSATIYIPGIEIDTNTAWCPV